MCICGSLPGHDECSRCALPPEEKNTDWVQPDPDPDTPPRPPLDYDGEEPF